MTASSNEAVSGERYVIVGGFLRICHDCAAPLVVIDGQVVAGRTLAFALNEHGQTVITPHEQGCPEGLAGP